MKVLIISNSEWDDNNSFGNTFNDFFAGLKNVEIANIYCREGKPNTNTCSKFLKISDKELLESILHKKYDPAKIVFPDNNTKINVTKNEMNIFNFIKQKRWATLFILREILWSFSNYKKQTFNEFIDNFAPDVIFLPTYSFAYINKMALYIQKKYKLPVISYMSDDEYSFRRFKISPFFWLLRFHQSKWSVRALKQSQLVYVISEIQRKECKRDLKIDCKILTKGADFSGEPKAKSQYNHPLQLVYTGNIGNNRYKTLAKIASAIKEINSDDKSKAFLSIYTATSLTKKMKRLLNVDGASEIKGCVSSKEVAKIQEDADMLIHVEAFDLKNRLEVHQSFSTKIVDYFKSARPIFAVGPKDVASISYLIQNDCAFYASNKKQIIETLLACINNSKLLDEKVKNSFICGKNNHNKFQIQKELKMDLLKVCGRKE